MVYGGTLILVKLVVFRSGVRQDRILIFFFFLVFVGKRKEIFTI